VTLIHSTKGHDVSNIANVHYSPGPTHENHPAPGVDLSPRGFPIHGGVAFEKHGRKISNPLEEDSEYQGPLLKPPGYGYTITKKFGVSIKHTPRRSGSESPH